MDPDGGLERLRQKWLKMGANEVRMMNSGDVVVSNWVRLKCQFGCVNYGKRLTCPPYTPTPDEFRKILSEYHCVMLIRYEVNLSRIETVLGEFHDLISTFEREAFLNGYYKVIGLASGHCPYCAECSIKSCKYPAKARPSMEACSIDVLGTAEKAGFSTKIAQHHKDKFSYYGLVLIV